MVWLTSLGNDFLVGGLEHEFYFSIQLGMSYPNWRSHIFQRGRYTTNQLWSKGTYWSIGWLLTGGPCLLIGRGSLPAVLDLDREIRWMYVFAYVDALCTGTHTYIYRIIIMRIILIIIVITYTIPIACICIFICTCMYACIEIADRVAYYIYISALARMHDRSKGSIYVYIYICVCFSFIKH